MGSAAIDSRENAKRIVPFEHPKHRSFIREKFFPFGATASMTMSSRRLYSDKMTPKEISITLEDAPSLKREPEAQIVLFDTGVSLLITRVPISHSASIVLDETEVAYPEPVTCNLLLVKSARLLNIDAPLYENREFEFSLSISWVR
jgi:hypothetical protein